jgi:hypothetical protein
MGVNTGFAEDLGHGVVERLERTPAAMQEVVAVSVHLTTRRDARHGTSVEIVERDRLRGESREIRCFYERIVRVGR